MTWEVKPHPDVIAECPAGRMPGRQMGRRGHDRRRPDAQIQRQGRRRRQAQGGPPSGRQGGQDRGRQKTVDEISFAINVDFEGSAPVAKFKEKWTVDIKAEVDYDLSGQTGTLDFTAKKSEDKKIAPVERFGTRSTAHAAAYCVRSKYAQIDDQCDFDNRDSHSGDRRDSHGLLHFEKCERPFSLARGPLSGVFRPIAGSKPMKRNFRRIMLRRF